MEKSKEEEVRENKGRGDEEGEELARDIEDEEDGSCCRCGD